MSKRLLIIILLYMISSQGLNSVQALSPVVDNAEQLVGIWDILNANNAVMDSIEVTIVVAKKSTARFSYKQLSLNSTTNSLEGFLTDDTVIFDLINLGQVQTYIAQVDFDIPGGPGFEIKTRLADCVTGVDSTTVVKKFRDRLADDSARCDGSSFNDSVLSNIKFVKRGVSSSLVPSTKTISADILADKVKVSKRVEAAWSVNASRSPATMRRLVIKDISSTYVGYKFTYRLLNNTTKLANLSQADFQTADRVGFIVNNFMIINPTVFAERNELFILKLDANLTQAMGRELLTDNGDCFPFKVNVIGVMACTPNDSSFKRFSNSKRINDRKASKIDTNLVIVF